MSEDKTMRLPVRPIWALGCSGLLLTISQGVLAMAPLEIRVQILEPPPCIINGDSTLNVPFGNELMTTRIDGVTYRKEVRYTVVCERQPSTAMTLKLQGEGASFDGASLKTSNKDLGVKLMLGGSDWPLNTVVKFTYPALPTMEAVLVKSMGSTLAGGAFSASATLQVELQ